MKRTLAVVTPLGEFTKQTGIAYTHAAVCSTPTNYGRPDSLARAIYWSRSEAGARKLAAANTGFNGWTLVGIYPVEAR